jgi:hypothetical protein
VNLLKSHRCPFKKLVFGLLCLVITINTDAQLLELQNLPASTKWKQINTDYFQIIFPAGFEMEANRTANIMESIRVPASQSLYNKPRKFSIVLQNRQGFSNGFVTIGPLRSEFFTISPQDYNSLGNVDWLEHLAVHEYRHMVQFSKAYSTVFNKLNYWLFGEYGLGAWASLAAPSWFWEGDAVGMETSMTATGRGRTPNFSMAYKANLVEKGAFNYSKQHLKSFKEFVPNHYVTGYFMTTHLKRKEGVDVWDKVIKRSFGLPFIPFAFSNAIKKETGKNLRQTYAQMSHELKNLYTNQVSNIPKSANALINKREGKTYTNYFYPAEIESGGIVVLKEGFSDISTFVAIDKAGNENEVFIPGIVNDPGMLSIKSDKILWTEYEFDKRWSKQSYSVIKSYDINSKEYKVLTSKSRYTSAALSPDGKLVVAIHNSVNNDNEIHLLDSNDGSLMKAFPNPNNTFYSMPTFSQDGKQLVLLKFENGAKSMIIKDNETGNEEIIVSSELENYGHPVWYKDFILYNSAFNGIDNIYAINMDTKAIYQITNVKFGAFNPSVSNDGDFLYYNSYSVNGMDVLKMPILPESWRPIQEVENLNFKYESPMVEGEGISDVLANRIDSIFEIQKYSQLKTTIKPFSWGLVSAPIRNSYTLGISSKNILNTTAISAGIIVNANEQTTLKFASISYQGLYPILDLFAYDGKRSTNEHLDDGSIQNFDWNETSVLAGVRVPLILTNSRFLRKISLRARVRATNITNYNNPKAGIYEHQNGTLKALEYQFQFVSLLKRSKLDINSRLGHTINLDYKHAPLGGDYGSNLFAAQSNVYFPGFFKHHSIRLRGSYQYEDKQNYRFSSPVTFTRGTGYIAFDTYTNVSINYALPLVYPDIHIGPLFNLQRVYANMFYDHGFGKSSGFQDLIINSYGAEVSANFNVMRFLPLLNLGVRYSYLPDFNDTTIQIIIGGVSF